MAVLTRPGDRRLLRRPAARARSLADRARGAGDSAATSHSPMDSSANTGPQSSASDHRDGFRPGSAETLPHQARDEPISRLSSCVPAADSRPLSGQAAHGCGLGAWNSLPSWSAGCTMPLCTGTHDQQGADALPERVPLSAALLFYSLAAWPALLN